MESWQWTSKKSIDFLGLNPSQQRCLVEQLRTKYAVRLISEVLGFNRNLFYYHPKSNPSEAELREEIETLALLLLFCVFDKQNFHRIHFSHSVLR